MNHATTRSAKKPIKRVEIFLRLFISSSLTQVGIVSRGAGFSLWILVAEGTIFLRRTPAG
jgi:hypothetical protein